MYSLYFFGGCRFAVGFRLWKYSGSISKCITDWRPERPRDSLQDFLELGVERYVLVDAKVGVG